MSDSLIPSHVVYLAVKAPVSPYDVDKRDWSENLATAERKVNAYLYRGTVVSSAFADDGSNAHLVVVTTRAEYYGETNEHVKALVEQQVGRLASGWYVVESTAVLAVVEGWDTI